ncbi:putative short-chain dehydrogenase/reductase SDR, NAD(P)-binding domain superfamily [Septoria linicola]|nr:putative short-chain dehydrogenase/reductase SDR, NAD(P)-binding domain superfamily [Septoria linicola]
MSSLGRLANKITGAASGIGRATAFAYAKEGAKVVCADIRETTRYEGSSEENGTTVERIRDLGGSAMFAKVDVTKPESVEGVVEAAVKEFGRLDVMFNNAGVSLEAKKFRPVWEIPLDVWQGTQDVNSTGVFLGTKYAVQQMLRQTPHASGDRGWIINTASILAYVGADHTAAYCASKGAVLNFTRAAALDCAPHRIHVNGLAPGYTESSMTGPLWQDAVAKGKLFGKHPFRGLGQPEDLARAAVFLASEDAQWVTGHTLPVEGGYLSQ